MILSGKKTEEYREIKSHWNQRLIEYFDLDGAIFESFDTVTFKNGYQRNAPEMIVEFKGIDIGEAKPEWSENWQGDVFRIKLGAVLSTNNLKTE